MAITYTPELGEKFCAALSSTSDSIATICKRKGMPSKATVFRWREQFPAFEELFQKAQSERVDSLFDECVEIADKCEPDKSAVQKARLQIHARIETAQRLKPKQYGTRTQLTGDGGGPIQTASTLDVSNLPTEVLVHIMRAKDAAEPV